jgi:ABC-2 type transport system ATP-binding protein
MAMVQQLCDSLAVISGGQVKATGAMQAIREGKDLETGFVELVGRNSPLKDGLEWLTVS